MYRIRHSIVLNKPYLPTVRQFSVFPYFKGEKAKLENKIKELEQIRNHEMVEKANLIKDHESEIKELTREHDNEKKRMKWFHGLDQKSRLNEFIDLRLQKEFDKGVLEKVITRLEKEIEKEKADRNLEIARLEADRNLEKIKTGYLNLNYLRLKGAVHLRGVFEQWELFSLSSFDGNRTKKWTDYLKENKDVFETFQNFYPNPKEIGVNHVVAEMTGFYRWLSERIHHGYAVGDYVEWRRNSLTPVRNKVSEYMCKELNLDYRIIESSETIDDEVD